MNGIIIYTETHRGSCIDGVSDADIEIYDDHISLYFEWLKTEAAGAGLDLALEDDGAGRSYYTETDEGEQFLESRADFWEWYN